MCTQTHPVDRDLGGLHQHLERDLEVLLEVESDGERDVPEDGEDLRLDHAVHVVVAEVLEEDGHDLVAEGPHAVAEGAAYVADETDRSMAHLLEYMYVYVRGGMSSLKDLSKSKIRS